MHPLRHPRNAIAVGVVFVLAGLGYWWVQQGFNHFDYAGVTMLGALGIAMGLMAYVLIAGSPSD
jgi:formate/nitrite transporter FocA (FNT family)